MAHHAGALRAEGASEEQVAAICRDPAEADLDERLRAMVTYAEKLTRLDEPMREADVAALRAAGMADDEIRDLAQVVAYFGYVNRHVEGLGVRLEEGNPDRRWALLAMGEPEG